MYLRTGFLFFFIPLAKGMNSCCEMNLFLIRQEY